jgi:hypothetical protein
MSQRVLSVPPVYRVYFSADGRALLDSTSSSGNMRVEPENSYRFDDQVIGRAFGMGLPDELSDLISVAMAVYVADRLCPRDPLKGDRHELHWTRDFELCLGLRCPERWTDRKIIDLLGDLLWFLTEDRWTFRLFGTSEQSAYTVKQGFLFSTPLSSPVMVSLFSGGLDSFAGLCRDIRERPGDTFITMAGYTNDPLGAIQRHLLRELRHRSAVRIIPVQIPFGLRRNGRSYNDDERTQRSRGFVYAMLGAATAIMAGTNRLQLYENGIGAINLPFTDGQLGTQSTRAAHPVTISMLGELIQLVTGRPFSIQLPSVFVTKGDLCRSIQELGVSDLAANTLSCDGFPLRTAGKNHCGRCTSCLLRRSSLRAAGLARYDDGTGYIADVYSPAAHLPDAYAYAARAMRDQAGRLRRALDSPNPWRSLTQAFPELVEVAEHVVTDHLPLPIVRERLVALYDSYCREWAQFEDAWAAKPLAKLPLKGS